MSIYNQFNDQRHAQIKNTFDAKMHKIDKLKAKAPRAEDDPKGEAEARANRHHLRVAAAEEYCDARKVISTYPQEIPEGKPRRK
jgi:hypothetical protein